MMGQPKVAVMIHTQTMDEKPPRRFVCTPDECPDAEVGDEVEYKINGTVRAVRPDGSVVLDVESAEPQDMEAEADNSDGENQDESGMMDMGEIMKRKKSVEPRDGYEVPQNQRKQTRLKQKKAAPAQIAGALKRKFGML